jgi:hypothetical protein
VRSIVRLHLFLARLAALMQARVSAQRKGGPSADAVGTTEASAVATARQEAHGATNGPLGASDGDAAAARPGVVYLQCPGVEESSVIRHMRITCSVQVNFIGRAFAASHRSGHCFSFFSVIAVLAWQYILPGLLSEWTMLSRPIRRRRQVSDAALWAQMHCQRCSGRHSAAALCPSLMCRSDRLSSQSRHAAQHSLQGSSLSERLRSNWFARTVKSALPVRS